MNPEQSKGIDAAIAGAVATLRDAADRLEVAPPRRAAEALMRTHAALDEVCRQIELILPKRPRGLRFALRRAWRRVRSASIEGHLGKTPPAP